MIDFRGRVMDYIKVFQDKMLTIICPFADQACLDKLSILALAEKLFTTYRNVPLFDVIDGINTSIKIPHHNKDFNPKEQVCCKELIDGLLDLLSIVVIVGGFDKVFCPELTSIPQSIPNT